MPTLSTTIAEAQSYAASIRPKVGGFPYLAEALRSCGVAEIHVVVPSMTTTYVTAQGDLVQQGAPQVPGESELPTYDEDALITTIRADQAGETTYPQFMARLWADGVLTYNVDLIARTCSYRSARGDRYVERYPAVDLSGVA